jgi:hypothetical protein
VARRSPAQRFARSLHTALLPALALACGGDSSGEPPSAPAAESAAPAAEREPAPAAGAAQPQFLAGEFSTPESVLYDPEQDVYFVSNINGNPGAADDNGFISRVSAAGGDPESRWIDGEGESVKLDAPKGMALVGEELWVADLQTVRRFDRRSGAPRGEIAIPESSFLNDLAAASPSGPVYVSDTAIKIEEGNVVPTGADAVFEIALDGSAKKLSSGEALNRPNGLAAGASGLWVVSYGGSELFRIVDGAKVPGASLPGGALDGLIELPDGTFLVSSWDSSGVYRGPAAGPFELAIPEIPAPADLGFDSKRQLVLVPHFNDDQVSAHPIAAR